ncbi:MAG: chemotaxis protein methyltransferase CheR [Oceanicoccus sp.]|jgi:chemotaxis protein methyltransferase CheR
MSVESAAAEYREFRDFLAKACGIVLGDNKQYLVASRLKRLMSDQDIENLGELIKRLQQFSNRSLKESVVDAMTTNETLWFRDAHPFNILKEKLLPELKSSVRPVRVWSAACSSGQEPYSISMMIEEFTRSNPGVLKQSVEIVATDLSRSMLDCCKEAEYDNLSLGRGLSPERLKQFFEPLDSGVWRVKKEVSQRVRLQQLNLMDSYSSLGKFDVVFCRNVLIYFSAELKADIFRRLHGSLRPGGYLVLGASESLVGTTELFDMVQCRPGIIYRAK